jgi:hypothetical protein
MPDWDEYCRVLVARVRLIVTWADSILCKGELRSWVPCFRDGRSKTIAADKRNVRGATGEGLFLSSAGHIHVIRAFSIVSTSPTPVTLAVEFWGSSHDRHVSRAVGRVRGAGLVNGRAMYCYLTPNGKRIVNNVVRHFDHWVRADLMHIHKRFGVPLRTSRTWHHRWLQSPL